MFIGGSKYPNHRLKGTHLGTVMHSPIPLTQLKGYQPPIRKRDRCRRRGDTGAVAVSCLCEVPKLEVLIAFCLPELCVLVTGSSTTHSRYRGGHDNRHRLHHTSSDFVLAMYDGQVTPKMIFLIMLFLYFRITVSQKYFYSTLETKSQVGSPRQLFIY